MTVWQNIEKLHASQLPDRLAAAAELAQANKRGEFPVPPAGADVNNHIHTFYSFSPYSASAAVFKSWEAGLSTCGLMDHDSIGGAEEFREAGRLFSIATTQGCEIRTAFDCTFLSDQRINNPDQSGIAYIALHGVPMTAVPALRDFLTPIREARLRRNRKMVDRLNDLIALDEFALDFERDIMPLSQFAAGGEITERHLLYALSLKLIAVLGKGPVLTAFVTEKLGLPLSEKTRAQLDDPDNPFYAYDLLGLFKGYYVEAFYVAAAEECPPIRDVAAFAQKHGMVLAYPYLGDVTASVTGDKKAQQFEDEYLDQLFPLLKELGFHAVTFMPSRNTKEQLRRLMKLCNDYGMFQISGEDINQPRQAFICEALRDPEYAHLYDAAWALIGHERAAEADLSGGMFSEQTKEAWPDLDGRIRYYRDLAQELYRKDRA